MAQAPQAKTTRIYLKSTIDKSEDERLWVVIKDKLFLGDMIPVFEIDGEKAKEVASVTSLITEWNFDDVDGNRLPINFDTVKDHILYGDFDHLLGEYYKILGDANETISSEQKKTSGTILTPSPTGATATPSS